MWDLRTIVRFVVMTVFALGLGLLVAAPQPAAASPSTISLTGGYTRSSSPPDTVVAYALNFTSPLTETAVVFGGIMFPEAATIIDAVAAPCEFTYGASGSGIEFMVGLLPGTSCTVTINVEFSELGVYTNADHMVILSAAIEGGGSVDIDPITTNNTITIEEAPAEPLPPAVCELTPDLAVSPELINLAPGGTAVIELAMRNLCKDAPTPSSDLLLSLSDGISVIETSSGMTNLGPRAAVQNFTLSPDETRRWTVTVSAAEQLVATPQHITEYYTGGRVSSRIDGVFITPAPAAPAAEPAPVTAAAPAAAAPAPIPAALPNTAGEQSTLPVAAVVLPVAPALLLAAAAAAFALSRRNIVG
jgi:hypothetical protein